MNNYESDATYPKNFVKKYIDMIKTKINQNDEHGEMMKMKKTTKDNTHMAILKIRHLRI